MMADDLTLQCFLALGRTAVIMFLNVGDNFPRQLMGMHRSIVVQLCVKTWSNVKIDANRLLAHSKSNVQKRSKTEPASQRSSPAHKNRHGTRHIVKQQGSPHQEWADHHYVMQAHKMCQSITIVRLYSHWPWGTRVAFSHSAYTRTTQCLAMDDGKWMRNSQICAQ